MLVDKMIVEDDSSQETRKTRGYIVQEGRGEQYLEKLRGLY